MKAFTLCALIFFALTLAGQKQQQAGEVPRAVADHETNRSDRPKNNSGSPSISEAAATANAKADAAGTSNPKNDSESINRRVMQFTGVLAFVAVLQLLAIWAQIHYFNKSAWIEHRAQIIAKVKYPIQDFELGKTPRVGIELFNSGNTPAYECVYEHWIAIAPHPFTEFPPNADYYKVPYATTIHRLTDIPYGIAIKPSQPLSQEQIDAIDGNFKRLCFRVRVQYIDAFKKNRFAEFAYSSNRKAIEPLPKYNTSN
jgi:hypothetical protein